MKTFVIVTMALVLLAGAALADVKPKEEFNLNYVGVGHSREGGEDHLTAVVITELPFSDTGDTSDNLDDWTSSSYDTAPDVVYSFTPDSDMALTASLCGSSYDTKLWIMYYDAVDDAWYAPEGGVNDDYCDLQSQINDVVLEGGVEYFLVVDGFGANSGPYVLEVYAGVMPPPPPANDTCEGAYDNEFVIPPGAFSLTGDNTYATADYTLVSTDSCTGYGFTGKDLVWVVCMEAGDMLTVTMTTATGFDASFYMVRDCADPQYTCVVGADDPEEITYTATETGIFYLICGGYSSGAGEFYLDGMLTGAGCGTVATEDTNWGSLKSLYR